MKILPVRRAKPQDTTAEDVEQGPAQRPITSAGPARPLADGYRIFLPDESTEAALTPIMHRSELPAPPPEPVAPVAPVEPATLPEPVEPVTPATAAAPVADTEPVEAPRLAAPTMPRIGGPVDLDGGGALDGPDGSPMVLTPDERDLIHAQALVKAERLLASRGPLSSPDLSYRYARDVTPVGADKGLRHMLDGGALGDLSDGDLSLAQVGIDVYARMVAELGFDPLD